MMLGLEDFIVCDTWSSIKIISDVITNKFIEIKNRHSCLIDKQVQPRQAQMTQANQNNYYKTIIIKTIT